MGVARGTRMIISLGDVHDDFSLPDITHVKAGSMSL